MLFKEYKFLKRQSDSLIELQEEYRNYLIIFKRICGESAKEKIEAESTNSDEKKNSFIVINRKSDYLKQSAIDFLKQHKLEKKINEINHLYSSNTKNCFENNEIKTKRRKIRRSRLKNNFVSLFNRNIKNDGYFMWPLNPNEFWISSFYGRRRLRNRKSNFHYGIDLAAMKGTIVKAAADGIILEACYNSGYGNTILISHDKQYKTRYAHLNSIKVKPGYKVTKGERIGTVGDTGSVRSSGRDASHLHFEVINYGERINPLYVLK